MAADPVLEEIQRLTAVYRDEVLAVRTRNIRLLGRKCSPQVLYTFLGFELKLGRKRLTCPDMTTARYLRIFGEIGAPAIRIPYDPTHTARLLPGLEAGLTRIKEELLKEPLNEQQHASRLRRVYARIRKQLAAAESES